MTQNAGYNHQDFFFSFPPFKIVLSFKIAKCHSLQRSVAGVGGVTESTEGKIKKNAGFITFS